MKIKDQVKLMRNIIKNEYNHVQDIEGNLLNLKIDKYSQIQDKQDELIKKLIKILPKENKNILNELIDLQALNESVLSEYYFKRGVKTGLTNLSFLREYETKSLL